MFAPGQIGIDDVPADASPALIAYLLIFGGPMLGIAVLNWMARNAEPYGKYRQLFLGMSLVLLRRSNGCMEVFRDGARPVAKVPCDSSADDCRLRGWQGAPSPMISMIVLLNVRN